MQHFYNHKYVIALLSIQILNVIYLADDSCRYQRREVSEGVLAEIHARLEEEKRRAQAKKPTNQTSSPPPPQQPHQQPPQQLPQQQQQQQR